MSEMIMVYITMPSEEIAKEVARMLLEKHLIACVTMMPCKSMYWWNGTIHDDQEYIMLAKTTENTFELLKEEVIKMHPYDVPCILKIVATADFPYAQWLRAEVGLLKS